MSAEIMQMRRKRMRGVALGILAVGLAGGVAACGSAEADGADPATDQEHFSRVINVEVMTVTPEPFVEEIQVTGTARANRDVMVAAEESGTIRKVFVDKGSHVAAGQPLMKIDDRILAAQVEQARAQAELARQTWERRKRLWENDRVGSEIVYLQAKFAAEQTAASLRSLEARLARTTIRAPFAGVMDDRTVEVGSMVAPGQTVARVIDLDPVKIVGGVPERFAADIRPGAQATVTFDVLEGQRFRAKVSFVGSAVDARNRTFPIELVLPNRDDLIKPEMVANVAVVRRVVQDAVVVPQDALVRVEDGYVVFVVTNWNEGPVAEVRPVQVGPAQHNTVVLEKGLVAGEKLIVVGQKSVADGDRVKVVEEH